MPLAALTGDAMLRDIESKLWILTDNFDGSSKNRWYYRRVSPANGSSGIAV